MKESSRWRMKFSCISSGCPEGARNWHILIFCHAEHGKIEAPVPKKDRGRNAFAVPPLVRRFLTETASWSANTLPRGNGRTRDTPTEPSSDRWDASSAVYSAGVPLPFPPSRGSLGRAFRVLLRINAIYVRYSIRFTGDCQWKITKMFQDRGMERRTPFSGLSELRLTSGRPPPRPAAPRRSPAEPPSPGCRR